VGSSEEDPPEGKVRETVEVRAAFSVTMVRPEGRVVRVEVPPDLGAGVGGARLLGIQC
jgi:hypothetical protein